MDLTIALTDADIDAANEARGLDAPSRCCPVALALRRLQPKAMLVTVGETIARFWDEDGREWVASLPDEAVRFIDDYDKREPVHPITFTARFADRGGFMYL